MLLSRRAIADSVDLTIGDSQLEIMLDPFRLASWH